MRLEKHRSFLFCFQTEPILVRRLETLNTCCNLSALPWRRRQGVESLCSSMITQVAHTLCLRVKETTPGAPHAESLGRSKDPFFLTDYTQTPRSCSPDMRRVENTHCLHSYQLNPFLAFDWNPVAWLQTWKSECPPSYAFWRLTVAVESMQDALFALARQSVNPWFEKYRWRANYLNLVML
jgi:hypothetical protein